MRLFMFTGAAALAALLLFPDHSAAQEKGKGKTAPRAKDGKPDLSGIWDPGRSFDDIGQPSLTAWAEKLYQERRANRGKDDPEKRCLPSGVPRISSRPYKIIQTPKQITMLFEGNIHSFRQFFIDGRGHPEDLDPLWFGHSIGSWEGDTLVVQTISFNERTWLNSAGYPHSDQLQVTERYRRPELGRLEITITLDDPKAFTKPHTFQRVHTLSSQPEIREYTCNEPPITGPAK